MVASNFQSNAATQTAARPRVLIIAPHGSYRTAPFIAAADRLGLEVLVGSEGQHSLVSGGAQGIHLDFSDRQGAINRLVEESTQRSFAAVIGTDDATTEVAEAVAAALGLPHNPVEAVRIARRKDLARDRLHAAGVPVPAHWRLDLRRPLAPQLEGLRYPCVAKPIAMSASRGVIRANNQVELLRACSRIATILRETQDDEERHTVLVEEFIPGHEYAVEGLLEKGSLRLLTIFDKPDPLDGPFFEETYYITPPRLSVAKQAAIKSRVAQACAAYGLHEGPIHAECRVNEAGVWILEVAARTIGGLCGRLLRFGTGLSLEEVILLHAARQRVEIRAEEGAAGVLMIPIPAAGILRRVEGIGAAEKVPYIEEINIQVREGYELVPLPEGASYLGFIFARAPTPEAAEAALRQAHGHLKVVVAPLWKANVSVSG